MDGQTATETWLNPDEALEYLADKYGVEYHVNTLLRKASTGQIPSEKVGKYRRFIPSMLDLWARGEWVEGQEDWDKVRAEERAKRRAG